MNEDLKYQVDIIRYIDQEMTEDERIAFESSLMTNKELANELREYQLLLEGIESWGDQLTKDKIKSYDKQLEQEGYFNKSHVIKSFIGNANNLKWIGLAASIAILVTAYIFLKPDVKLNPVITYATYYKVDEKLLTKYLTYYQPSGMVNSDTLHKDSLYLGLQAFQQKNYGQTVSFLKPLQSQSVLSDPGAFYLALAFIQVNEFQNAIDLLIPLTNCRSFELREESKWYLALSNMQSGGNIEGTKALLRELSQSSYSDMAAKAGSLLAELK